MSTKPPWTTGASLTAKAALHGDPAAPFACATMLAWHKEVWKAACACPGPHQDLPTLRRQWEVTPDATTWANTKGPIARARLELQRVGWRPSNETQQPAFEWVDDQGLTHNLTLTPPILLIHLIQQTWQRIHERGLAEAAGLQPRGPTATAKTPLPSARP